MSKESETPSGIRLMLLLKEHLREIMNRECANQASIHLYCTGSYLSLIHISEPTRP